MLQVNNVSLSFPKVARPVLKNISFELKQGECTCLIGPSGSGKTSLLRIIAGLQKVDLGSVSMLGRDITDIPAEKRDIVMVFQSDLLFPFLSVEQNIAFGLNFCSMNKEEKQREVKAILELIQLPGIGNKMPYQLSAGQRQRVALARSLVLKPKLLLLDEPLSNLDPDLQQSMRKLLLTIKDTFDITMLCVTHSPEDILFLADTIGFISNGMLIQYGKEHEFFERPKAVEVAMFFGNSNFLHARYHKTGIQCMQTIIPQEHWPEHWLSQSWDFEEGSDILLSCRPEHAVIRTSNQNEHNNATPQNRIHYDTKRGLLIQASIDRYAYSPAGTRYSLNLESSIWNVQQKDHVADTITEGHPVEIQIPKKHLWIIKPNVVL